MQGRTRFPSWSRRWRRTLLFLGLILPQTGCGAGWRQPASPGAERAWKPRQQVQVWRQGEALRLHGVIVSAESLSGIPFLQPLGCDSCRIGVPRSAIDSLRVGNPTAGFLKSVGLGLSLPLVALIVMCGATGGCELGY